MAACSRSRAAGCTRRRALSSYLLGATLRGCRRGGATAAAVVLLSTLAVLVAGATLGGDLALALSEAAWRADLRLVVVLREAGTRPEAPDGIVARARALPGVADVRYVGPAVALAELRRLLGPRGEGLDRLPSNPLPPRLEVTPAPALGAADLEALVETLDRLPGVMEVQAAFGWVEPLERVRRGLLLGGLALAAVLGLAALGAAAGAAVAARRAGAEETGILGSPGSRRSVWPPRPSSRRSFSRPSDRCSASRSCWSRRSRGRRGLPAGSARCWASIPCLSCRLPGWPR